MNEKEFLEKKEEYLKRLNLHLDIVSKMVKSDNESNLKTVPILLDPKNDLELEFANMFFKLEEIVYDITNMINFEILSCESIEESNSFNFMLDYIRACLNNVGESEKKEILEKYHLNDFENCAIMGLEMPMVLVNEEARCHFFKKLGVTEEIDDRFILLLNNYLGKIQRDIGFDRFLTIDTEEDLKKCVEYSNKYYQICNDFKDKYFRRHNK